MTMPIVFLIDGLLVWKTKMYMFDLDWRYNRHYNWRQFRSNMYIPVSHTNGGSIKNTIGVIMNRLVGMGLKGHTHRVPPSPSDWSPGDGRRRATSRL